MRRRRGVLVVTNMSVLIQVSCANPDVMKLMAEELKCQYIAALEKMKSKKDYPGRSA
jgi:uncharacterized UBP type Zn finger protein